MASRLRVIIFGSGARAFALCSQLVVLFIMSRVLPKAEFGDVMIAFGLYRLLSSGLGTGLGSILLYRCSRRPENIAFAIRLHRTVLLFGLLTSTVVCGVCILGAGLISSAFGKPNLAPWLIYMAPLTVAGTCAGILTGAFEGRSWITSAIVYTEALPNGIRLALLPLVLLLDLPHIAVAHILTLSVLVPSLLGAWEVTRRDIVGVELLTRWDLGYAGKFTLYALASNQLLGVDMLAVGAFFTSDAAADYAIAARIASLFPFFQVLITRQFAPRAGFLIAQRDFAELQHETDICRGLSVLAVGGTVALIVGAAPWVLPLLGNYTGVLPLIVLLAAGPFIRAFFAGGAPILQIAGFANWSLGIMLTSFAVILISPLILGPLIGIYSLPAGMLISAAILNPIIALVIHRQFAIRLLTKYWEIAAIIAGSTLTVCVVVLGVTASKAVAFSLTIAAISIIAFFSTRVSYKMSQSR